MTVSAGAVPSLSMCDKLILNAPKRGRKDSVVLPLLVIVGIQMLGENKLIIAKNLNNDDREVRRLKATAAIFIRRVSYLSSSFIFFFLKK